MSAGFWIKRFLLVYAGAFTILLVSGLLRSRPLAQTATESALWAGVGSGIFTATRIFRSRRGEHCELCGDTPDRRNDGSMSCGSSEVDGPAGFPPVATLWD